MENRGFDIPGGIWFGFCALQVLYHFSGEDILPKLKFANGALSLITGGALMAESYYVSGGITIVCGLYHIYQSSNSDNAEDDTTTHHTQAIGDHAHYE